MIQPNTVLKGKTIANALVRGSGKCIRLIIEDNNNDVLPLALYNQGNTNELEK